MIKEMTVRPMSGWGPFFAFLGLLVGGPTLIFVGAIVAVPLIPVGILSILAGVLVLFGFQAVAPNDARVLLLFGNYRGSITDSGFYWVNPFYSKRKVTLRVRNFETGAITTPERKDAAGTIVQHRSRSAGRP